MTPDEKKRKFEEDLIEVAVAEYYHWVGIKALGQKLKLECFMML